MRFPWHPSSSHRAFSRRCWSLWTLGRALAEFLLRRWVPQGSGSLAGDDLVDEHRGAKVYGKGRHRDPVRSTRRARSRNTWPIAEGDSS